MTRATSNATAALILRCCGIVGQPEPIHTTTELG